MIFEWSSEKNEWLKRKRGISFEEIALLLGDGHLWRVTVLNREVLTNNTSFVVYTGTEGIPTALRSILETLDIEHEERPNQLLHRTQSALK